MSRVAIVTLGCPKNAVDSEGIGGLLAAAGHDVSESPAGADVVLVNTCGFIDPARRETIQEVLELSDLKAKSSVGGLVLTGCLVARSADELAEALPEVDAFVDFDAYGSLPEIVQNVVAGTYTQRVFGTPGTRFDPAWWDASMAASPRVRFGRAPWSYLKIAEGCDRGCAFCAIPLMRGKFRSRPLEVIEREARHLVAAGVSELSLVSQDSVMWGRDTDEGGLVTLLRALEQIDGLRRVRLMYLYPSGVTDELVDTIIGSDKIASYFDLSLQHASERVLRAMGRWGSRQRFERLIERIRAADPLAGIRTTFIVGFPGERDDDAEEIEDFVGASWADWIGVFTFSREEGTRSNVLPDQVPSDVARARAEALSTVAETAMEARAHALVGTRREVLVERRDIETGEWTGRSDREAPEIDGEIRFTGEGELRVGDYVFVDILANEGTDLIGRVA